MQDYLDQAIVCENGHILNPGMRANPDIRPSRCPHCGARAIRTCEKCGVPIQGSRYQVVEDLWEKTIDLSLLLEMSLPRYCQECGAAFPWTSALIAASKELIEESQLDAEQKVMAEQDVADIIGRTPRQDAAAKRLKRLASGVGEWFLSELRSLLVDVMSETVKKIIM